MSTSPPTSPTDRAARLAAVEALRQLLRRHGQGQALVDTEDPSSQEGPGRLGPLTAQQLLASLESGSLGLLSGHWSSGKTSLAISRVAQLGQEGHLTAIIDGPGRLFPPALALMRVPLERVLILRPPPPRAIWAAEQVLRSGLFALVVFLTALALNRPALRRLQLAAERGQTAGLLVPQAPTASWAGLIARHFQVEAPPPEGSPRSVIAAPPRPIRVHSANRRGAASPPQRPTDVAFA